MRLFPVLVLVKGGIHFKKLVYSCSYLRLFDISIWKLRVYSAMVLKLCTLFWRDIILALCFLGFFKTKNQYGI